MTAVAADADTLPLFPLRNTGTHGIDDAGHFMSWNARILNSGPRAFLGENVTVANATGLHLIRTCRSLGFGISRSTIWKSAPGLETCATFIVATATVIEAINPRTNCRIVEKQLLSVATRPRLLSAP